MSTYFKCFAVLFILICNHTFAQNINYTEAFQKTVFFLEMQRDGAVSDGVTLPDGTVIPNRVNWRANSYMSDGKAIKNDPYAPNGIPDLTGGWFDAGDPPKWTPALASATTMMAWGVWEYMDAYKKTNQLKYVKGNLKWINDYFLKCFRFDPNNPTDVSKYRIYVVVGGSGGGSGIEKYQGVALNPTVETLNEQVYLSCPHEVIENTIFNLSDFPNYQRPVYYADKDAPAIATVSVVAAAMASSSLIFRGDASNAKDVAYANLLLERAKMLANFAKTYVVKNTEGGSGARSGGTLKNRNGNLVDSEFAGGRWDNDLKKFRPGVEYSASLCWAHLWIHEAEYNKNSNYGNSFLGEAVNFTDNSKYPLPTLFDDGSRASMFAQAHEDWGKLGKFNSTRGTMCYVLLAKFFGKDTEVQHTETAGGKGATKYTYGQVIESLCNESIKSNISASGMPEFGPTHLALSGMQAPTFALLVSADKILTSSHPKFADYISFAKLIIDYGLGSNKYNRSFLVGFTPKGKTASTNVLHGPAQGFWDGPKFSWNSSYPASDELGDFSKAKPRHVCYGGLTSPNYDGTFNPNGYDGSNQEVGPVYQQGFEGNLARMVEKLGTNAGSLLPDFPAPEATDGKEYYVRVKQLKSTANSFQLSALIVNHSAWPAVLRKNMSFKYYFTKEAGSTVTASIDKNTSYALNGLVLSTPKQETGDLYYVEASFPNIAIYPGGCKESPDSKLDVNQFPRYPHHEKEIVFTLTSTGAWNNGNDWSYTGIGQNATTTRGYSDIENIPIFDKEVYLAGKLPPGVITGKADIQQSDFNSIKIYPNPSKNIVNIKASSSGDVANLQLIDAKGIILSNSNINTTNQTIVEQINLSEYSAGLYILKITDVKSVRYQKVVKE